MPMRELEAKELFLFLAPDTDMNISVFLSWQLFQEKIKSGPCDYWIIKCWKETDRYNSRTEHDRCHDIRPQSPGDNGHQFLSEDIQFRPLL